MGRANLMSGRCQDCGKPARYFFSSEDDAYYLCSRCIDPKVHEDKCDYCWRPARNFHYRISDWETGTPAGWHMDCDSRDCTRHNPSMTVTVHGAEDYAQFQQQMAAKGRKVLGETQIENDGRTQVLQVYYREASN